MISLRLNPDLEHQLNQKAQAQGLSRSEYLRNLILEDLEKDNSRKTPYELGKEVFGRYGSGRSDLSTNRKKLLTEILREKHRRH